MMRNLLIAAMLAAPLLAFVPNASAWVCHPDPQQACETVQDEIVHQHACVAAGDGLHPTADCAVHGALPGVLVCYPPSIVTEIVC